MIRIIATPSEKQQLIEESRFLHDECGLDSDKINSLMHLHVLPSDAWVIIKDSYDKS